MEAMREKRDYISIVIPVYNAEDYLNRCMESLRNQTYDRLEIILVDDGSKDASPALCDHWAQSDSRVKSLHQPNGGAASARNTGLDAASGGYIMFVDADDYVDNRLCETLLAELERRPETDCVICGLAYVDDHGPIGQTQAVDEPMILNGLDAIRDRYVFDRDRLNIVGPCGKLFRREIWDGLRFTSGLYYEDMDIMPYLFTRCATVSCIPYIGYFYYQREGSCSHGTGTDDKRVLDSFLIREKHIHFFESLGETEIANAVRRKLLDLIITSDCNGWIPDQNKKESDQLYRENWKYVLNTSSYRDKLRYTIYRFGGAYIYKLFSH